MKKFISACLYDQEYYQKYNHGYDEFAQSMSLLPEFEKFLRSNIKKGDNVLDVGCGRGETVLLCCKLGADCMGIDYSKAAVKIAQDSLETYLKKSSIKKQVKVMNAKDLKFKTGSFDVVIMLDIVEHLYDWELKKALKEANRVLKKGGKLLVHTSPNKNNMAIIRRIAHLFGIKLISETFHVNEQTPESIKRHLQNLHLKIDVDVQKDTDYFSKQMRERGNLLKYLAKLADILYDSRIMSLAMRSPLLAQFLSTDIYVVCKKLKTD